MAPNKQMSRTKELLRAQFMANKVEEESDDSSGKGIFGFFKEAFGGNKNEKKRSKSIYKRSNPVGDNN